MVSHRLSLSYRARQDPLSLRCCQMSRLSQLDWLSLFAFLSLFCFHTLAVPVNPSAMHVDNVSLTVSMVHVLTNNVYSSRLLMSYVPPSSSEPKSVHAMVDFLKQIGVEEWLAHGIGESTWQKPRVLGEGYVENGAQGQCAKTVVVGSEGERKVYMTR
jgi:hypothetical protein